MKKAVKILGILLIFVMGLIATTPCFGNPEIIKVLNRMPEYKAWKDILNHEWENEEEVVMKGYSGDAMEIGISPDSQFLLFNDGTKPNKDMHWSTRINDLTYQYKGKVQNTVSDTVDGTPCFDQAGYIYYTTLKDFPGTQKSIYKAQFKKGHALNPYPIDGNIYQSKGNRPPIMWISLDPAVTLDSTLLFYSEGQFNPRVGFPYPFNIRGAEKRDGQYFKLNDSIMKNINTDHLEYAPAISPDGLELYFSRIGKINGRPHFVGIFVANRDSKSEPFKKPEKIMAITGDVEAPVLSGDALKLYYHRMTDGRFKVFRVSRKTSNS